MARSRQSERPPGAGSLRGRQQSGVVAGRGYVASTPERLVASVASLAVITTILYLAISNQRIEDENVAVMLRIILSLAVAVIGATVPGFLQVGWDLKGVTIRAGGALALFVICYFASPPIIEGKARPLERVEASFDRIIATTEYDEVDKEIEAIRDIALQQSSNYLSNHVVRLVEKYMDGTFDASGDFTRTKRRKLVELALVVKKGDLRKAFSDGFFYKIDLVEVNFRGANLSGVGFEKAFVIWADFTDADLRDSSFEGAWIRLSDFSNAKLQGANFQGVDWFNAVGFTAETLKASKADSGTILQCPGQNHEIYDEAAFIQKHDSLYTRFKYREFSKYTREKIHIVWKQYAGPEGLCAAARRLKTASR
jgi:hypothetical protein